MQKKSFEEFTSFCDRCRCPKGLKYNPKTCVKDYRRERCYRTYIQTLERKEEKQKAKKKTEDDFRRESWIELYGSYPGSRGLDFKLVKSICSIWKILDEKERRIVESDSDFSILFGDVDVCHINNKSTSIDKKYDVNNVYLGSRFFHRRLTDMKHPVTKQNISFEQAMSWDKAAKYNDRSLVIE